MRNWIKENKNLIEAIFITLQSIVVILGVGFAFHELFLKNIQFENLKISRTINYTEKSNSAFFITSKELMLDLENRQLKVTEKQDKDMGSFLTETLAEFKKIRNLYEPYFETLNVLISKDLIDLEIACPLLCDNAGDYVQFVDRYSQNKYSDMNMPQYPKFSLFFLNMCEIKFPCNDGRILISDRTSNQIKQQDQ